MLIIVASLMLPFFAHASNTVGTINVGSVYGWGEKAGWLNFGTPNSSVVITDSRLTGYFWSDAFGWVNLAPNLGGVFNNNNGVLSGAAWAEGLGYIDFTGIVINSVGRFTGTSGTAGSLFGRITFDCDNCSVTTDYRPANVRPSPVSGGGGGGGGGGFIPAPNPGLLNTNNSNVNTNTNVAVNTNVSANTNSGTPVASAPIPAPVAVITLKPPATKLAKTLKLGDKSNDVKALQKFLNSNLYIIVKTGTGSPGKESNLFGAATKAALIKFQTKYNLLAEKGFVGPKTRQFINDITNPPKLAIPTPAKPAVPVAVIVPSVANLKPPAVALKKTINPGASSSDIQLLQKFLNANGYVIAKSGAGSLGKETTLFGSGSKAALIKFQTDFKLLSEKGYVGPKTRAFINGLSTNK